MRIKHRIRVVDEVPNDDGTPTGLVFLVEDVATGVDPLTGEPDWRELAYRSDALPESDARVARERHRQWESA